MLALSISAVAARPAASAAAIMCFFIFRFLFCSPSCVRFSVCGHPCDRLALSDSPVLELWGAEIRITSVDSWVVGVIRSLSDDVCHEWLHLLLLFLSLHVSFPLAARAVYRGFSGLRRPFVGLVWSLNCRKCITLPVGAQGGFEKKLKKVFRGHVHAGGRWMVRPLGCGVYTISFLRSGLKMFRRNSRLSPKNLLSETLNAPSFAFTAASSTVQSKSAAWKRRYESG